MDGGEAAHVWRRATQCISGPIHLRFLGEDAIHQQMNREE
jgi:hypothetical protein